MAAEKKGGPPHGYGARLLISPSKSGVGALLSRPIIESCASAIDSRGAFSIALSGGSLPSFLRDLPRRFAEAGVDPHWEGWHVFLADERCVPETDGDSNLGAIRSNFSAAVPIPAGQVYGIDQSLMDGPTDALAEAYENTVLQPLLKRCGGMIDCVVLGFGPDGHTCSLFPGHSLLEERSRLVAAINDSPKPPPSRITLTLPVLNGLARRIVFCGAGSSKGPILKATFGSVRKVDGEPAENHVNGPGAYEAQMTEPAPYPCGMVRPEGGSLVWVVDRDAAREGGIVVDEEDQ